MPNSNANPQHWPHYVSHKIVRAAKIVSISQDSYTRAVKALYVLSPDGVDVETFKTTVPEMMQHAVVGGYAVVYAPDEKHPEGFRSVSPPHAFEQGYTAYDPLNITVEHDVKDQETLMLLPCRVIVRDGQAAFELSRAHRYHVSVYEDVAGSTMIIRHEHKDLPAATSELAELQEPADPHD